MARQLSSSRKKKIRGVRRRLRYVLRMAASAEEYLFDTESDEGMPSHWDYKLPIAYGLVEGPHSSIRVKKICIEALLETCSILIRKKTTAGAGFKKVVAAISYPGMFSSRVCIFFDKKYYESFFDRSHPYQTWTLLPAGRSLLKELQIKNHFGLVETGYSESMFDEEDGEYKGELWFYGAGIDA